MKAMGAHEKQIARRFIPAFVLGDVEAAAAFLADDVDFVDGKSVWHGIEHVGSFIDPLQDGERRELSGWKLKEVDGVVVFRGICASRFRDDADDCGCPSAYAEVSLGLRFHGDKIVHVEALPY